MLLSVPKHLIKPELVTVYESLPDAEVLHVFSDVDMATADEFEKEINALPASDRIVVNLVNCRFIDSTALGALIRVYKRLRNQLRIVVSSTSQVDRILQLALLNEFLPVTYSLADALA